MGQELLLSAKVADKSTFVRIFKRGIQKECFNWEVEHMVPVLQVGPLIPLSNIYFGARHCARNVSVGQIVS